ncbi:hypothetical protein SNEBB_002981 [Seison nebaliae]|nr:hypothetical protein SNEBB_002981 [Seison nebaliae]
MSSKPKIPKLSTNPSTTCPIEEWKYEVMTFIPYENEDEMQMDLRTMSADKQVNPHQLKRRMEIIKKNDHKGLKVTFQSDNLRKIRVAVNVCLDHLALAAKTRELFNKKNNSLTSKTIEKK